VNDDQLEAFVLGPTHFDWHPAVAAVVHEVTSIWPHVRGNTYLGHPWPGWDQFSIDFWNVGGRGDALDSETARSVRKYLHARSGPPLIRHTILGHRLFTSWGGYSYWPDPDHSGEARHVHVTYWPL
jgi:hypothetical protein